MSAQAATRRAVVCLLPAVVAALIRLPLPMVVGLAVLGVAVMLGGVGSVLADPERTSRNSRFAVVARGRQPEVSRPPRDLERMRTLVAGRAPTAVGVHLWLRPLLADIAATRLLLGHGIDLADPAAAHRVPQPLWDLIRPDRPEPADRNAPGVTAAELGLLVDQLEDL